MNRHSPAERRLWLKAGLFILAILGFGLVAYDFHDTIQLTIINKADMGIGVSLEGIEEEQTYYLTVPAGNKLVPAERTFTIVRDVYSVSVTYIEYYDPVYGFKCSPSSGTLTASKNMKLIIFPCSYHPPNGGEPSAVKFGGGKVKR
jgi:hypothetical protein